MAEHHNCIERRRFVLEERRFKAEKKRGEEAAAERRLGMEIQLSMLELIREPKEKN